MTPRSSTGKVNAQQACGEEEKERCEQAASSGGSAAFYSRAAERVDLKDGGNARHDGSVMHAPLSQRRQILVMYLVAVLAEAVQMCVARGGIGKC